MRFLGCLITFFASCVAQDIPSCSVILNYIEENLPDHGTLKSSNGFVYVDLDDDYIHKLVTFIEKDGFQEPPYFEGDRLAGAHITVIYPEEMSKYGVKEIKECGEMISFVPTKCQVAHPLRLKEIDEVYLVIVEAPQLDNIREKYGLPKRKYDFHITIGAKPMLSGGQ